MTSNSEYSFEEFIKDATTSRGARNVDLEQLEGFLAAIRDNNFWLPRIEVSEVNGDREIPKIALSLIGGDGAENWENHQNQDRHWALVQAKLRAAHASALPLVFRVWAESVTAMQKS